MRKLTHGGKLLQKTKPKSYPEDLKWKALKQSES